MTVAEPTTWSLTPTEFAATKAQAAKINERAAKRGFTGRIEVTGTEREVTETDEAGLPRTRVLVDTVITGEAPCYNGWSFLAAVDSVGDEFVLRTAPGVEESGIDRKSLVAGRCQHCNTVRSNRLYTYLVKNTETGETKQVGSTCIKDFTGWTGKPVFISVDDLEGELEGFLSSGAYLAADYDPETVVAAAWAISRLYGWVAASNYGPNTPTKGRVENYLYGKSPADRELREEVAPYIAEATTMAKTIITSLLEGLEGNGDYVQNLKTCLRAAYVADRHMGIVVSAVSAYERMVGTQVRKAAQAKAAVESQYAGKEGERITVTGKVTRLVPVEGDYGTSMMVIIEGGTTVAKTVATAAWVWDVEQGDEVTITGTIKALSEYNGTKQTVLTRTKKVA